MKLLAVMLVVAVIAATVVYLNWYLAGRNKRRQARALTESSQGSLDMALLLKDLLAADEQMPVLSKAQRAEAERLTTDYFGKRPRTNQGDQ